MALGFRSYAEYLDSPLWEIIRRAVFQRDCFKCQIKTCKTKKDWIQAHHVSYSLATLLGVNPGAIVTLCHKHHQLVEFSGKGVKLTLERVQRKTVKYFRVANNRKPRSVADWLRYRFRTQQSVARRVALLLRGTVFYSRLIECLRNRKLPREYYEHLGIQRNGNG